MTPFNPAAFFETPSSRNNGINTKSSKYAYEMYKFVNYAIWWRKLETNTVKIIPKKLMFGQAYMKFDGWHGHVKSDGHTIDISVEDEWTATGRLSPLD